MSDVVQQAISFINFVVTKIDYTVTAKGFGQEVKSDVEVGHRLSFGADGSKFFTVIYELDLGDKEAGFYLKVEALAFFETRNPIDDEFRKSPLPNLNAVAIGFPFLRSFISTVSINAGYPRIILPTVNLHKRSKAGESETEAAEPEEPKLPL